MPHPTLNSEEPHIRVSCCTWARESAETCAVALHEWQISAQAVHERATALDEHVTGNCRDEETELQRLDLPLDHLTT